MSNRYADVTIICDKRGANDVHLRPHSVVINGFDIPMVKRAQIIADGNEPLRLLIEIIPSNFDIVQSVQRDVTDPYATFGDDE